MPNPIKYTVGSETNALKKGNYYIGTGDVGKGPSDITGYYQGPNVPSGGYVIYMNKPGAPGDLSYHSAANDGELITFTNEIAETSFTSATQCLVYYSNQTDSICFNIDYPPIITDGLVLNVDAGFSPSYPTSGVTWNDISGGNNNGTLTNGPTFSFNSGGSIVFDGVDDYISSNATAASLTGINGIFTLGCWFKTSQIAQQMLVCCPDNPRFYIETFNRSGNLVAHWGLGDTNNSSSSSAIINTNIFYFYLISYDGNVVNSYLNGILTDTNIIGAKSYNSNTLRIGKYTDVFPLQLNGNISQVLIYNKILTAQEVLQNYNATKNRYIFTSTWNTANTSAGSSTSTQVKLPLVSTGTYNMLVDWGDGTTDTITTWNQAETTHTYSSSGVYEIKISGICRGFRFANTGDRLKLLNISQYGILDLSTDRAFNGCTNFNATATDTPIISTTNLSLTFQGCTNFNGNVGNWNVSNVTGMQQMFQACTNFNNGGSPSIGNWNTSNVTNMVWMFGGAREFDQNIGGWDVSNVTTITASNAGMFFGTNMKFNNGGSPSINNWNISKITNLTEVFGGCFRFNQPIGNWNVSNVTSMNQMFLGCTNFNQDLGNWDVSKITIFNSIFQSCTNFNNGGSPSINNWVLSTISNVNMGNMFFDCSNFNQPIGNWNTLRVTNMQGMFKNCFQFNQYIGDWNTSNVTNMLWMFRGASQFNQDISNWDVSNVTTMGGVDLGMFLFATSFNQNLGSWNLRLSGVNLIEIFRNSGMSCQNYTDTIVGWANYVASNSNTPINVNMATQSGRRFDGTRSGGAGFASATAARTFLTTATPTGAGWTISGDVLGGC